MAQRLRYLDTRVSNTFGIWHVDLAGDELETVRLMEGSVGRLLDDVVCWHWSRLDVAFDVAGVELGTLPRPGTVISNDGRVETVYSHNLRSRGNFAVFGRAYDAHLAGHDVEPGIVRLEIEFKHSMPDTLKSSPMFPLAAYMCAAFHIRRIFGVELPTGLPELDVPVSRLINHERERFYRRFGKRILTECESLGQDAFCKWIRDCIGGVDDATKVR